MVFYEQKKSSIVKMEKCVANFLKTSCHKGGMHVLHAAKGATSETSSCACNCKLPRPSIHLVVLGIGIPAGIGKGAGSRPNGRDREGRAWG